MPRRTFIRLLMMTTVLLCGWLPPWAEAVQNPGALMAASDGEGGIRLIWFAPDGVVPAAWRLEEEVAGQSKVIEARIVDASSQASAAAPARASTAPGMQAFGRALAAMRVMSDWELAQARGVARELHKVPAGERRYRVVPLDASGQALEPALRSRALDSSKADPLPSPVEGLRATVTREGVELYWQPGREARNPPAIAWLIERDGHAVADAPLILGERWAVEDRAFVDEAAPRETLVHYRVATLDIFGRRGPWSEHEFFVVDLRALDAPAGLQAVPEQSGIRLRWTENPSPHTAGYLPERARQRGGPYEALDARAVPRGTTEFVDRAVEPGVHYYYRLRAMDPRGALGAPSLTVAVRQPDDAPVPVPRGLRSEVGTSAVVLRWDPIPGVAGYYLQRRAGAAGEWRMLNDTLTPEPRYDDTALASGSRYDYRVIAVGHDNRESTPGDPVSVQLRDQVAPHAPHIVAASGADGHALLRFEAAEPAQETAQILVLRAGSAEETGLVIGEALDGSAREWRDDWVQPGSTYWYRLVALDATGNRSDIGQAVAVRIGGGLLPAPAAPLARWVTRPVAGIELRFKSVPPDLAILVQRREGGRDAWRTIAGPLAGEFTIDTMAPSGALEYRLLYRGGDGTIGPPSPVVAVQRP